MNKTWANASDTIYCIVNIISLKSQQYFILVTQEPKTVAMAWYNVYFGFTQFAYSFMMFRVKLRFLFFFHHLIEFMWQFLFEFFRAGGIESNESWNGEMEVALSVYFDYFVTNYALCIIYWNIPHSRTYLTLFFLLILSLSAFVLSFSFPREHWTEQKARVDTGSIIIILCEVLSKKKVIIITVAPSKIIVLIRTRAISRNKYICQRISNIDINEFDK